MELIPRLAETREFAVWPFEGELSQLLPHRGIVLAEHPDWHPRLSDPDERKRRFRDEFGHWFHG
ncbi:MAG: hypothetical protein OXG35_32615 [Acidobacteria bacterium]|nr:hypothetical protein [Acidobacteriota bacterium]